ncbi:hemolysin-III related [Roseovarius litorisediminis]|uniref:Hemolysin-III related n=1 Tax=Roseovarius litorisediminis TaxID=1312363 RepID=A0A1Y5SZZ2_9RHOB|nr:hemolysin III family protein [Roseovarius litorisediminis]SLN50880.1 hemolysin-III related [Roseovarius litorisediminis]
MSYPNYTRAERIADGAVHIVGILLALMGIMLVFTIWALPMNGPVFIATVIYSIALLTMLCASATYHMAAHTTARPILRRLDHAAIYVKIAGTFTPLSVFLGTAFGYALLAMVWALALAGATAKLMAERGKMTTGAMPYLALGWAGVALFIPLTGVLPATSLWLMLAGGLLYTSGVVFYHWESLRFANAIWHTFIVTASGCFFLGISGALAAGF